MFQNPSVSPLADPTTVNAIQQIAQALNDVDQRIQILRLAVSQTVPPFAGRTAFGPLGAGSAFGPQGISPYAMLGAPWQAQAGFAQIPLLNPYAQQIPGIGYGALPGTYGGLGVTAPFGLQAPGAAFRPW